MGRFRRPEPEALPALPWSVCPAKTTSDGRPGLSVHEHCRIVGEVARALVAVLPAGVRRLLGEHAPAVAGVHDIGKISPGFLQKHFQTYLEAALPAVARIHQGFCDRHAVVSEAALNMWLGAERVQRCASVAAIAGAHHGERSEAAPLDDGGEAFGGLAWSSQRRECLEQLTSYFGALPSAPPPETLALLTGLVCVADWIGSAEELFPPDASPPLDQLPARAAQAVAQCGWQRPCVRPGLSFADVFGFPPRPFQSEFAEGIDGPGLYVLEAPMGEGKTEAALYGAYRLLASGVHHGLYFGLPTRLTSDRIHLRVEEFVKRVAGAGTRLAHGEAWLQAFSTGGARFLPGDEWFHPRKRALLYPFAVGTIDQALLSVVNVRHAFVRAFGLAGKVVILDEVHSYDTYTSTLIDTLVRDLLAHACTVVVLSATLTPARRSVFFAAPASLSSRQEYPLLCRETERGTAALPLRTSQHREIQVEVQALDGAALAEMAVARAGRGQCVVCIANTVGLAQGWFNAVKGAAPATAIEVGLLHSRFPGWRRAVMEQEWMAKLGKPGSGQRPAGCVLVATQILEQSVDVDADFMASALAPSDMLLQRLGRLWRHERPGRPSAGPVLCLVAGAVAAARDGEELIGALEPSNARVYAPYVLYRSFQVWAQRPRIVLPDDIRGILQETYEPVAHEPDFVAALRQELEARRDALAQHARAAMAEGLPTRRDEEHVVTRYSDYPMVSALLVKAVDDRGATATLRLSDDQVVECSSLRPDLFVTRQLYANRVPVPAWALPPSATPRYLAKHFHEATPVLLIQPDGTLLLDQQPTRLRYDPYRGLSIDPVHSSGGRPRPAAGPAADPFPAEDLIDELDW